MVTLKRRSRLSRSIQNELIKYFCAGTTARSAAELTGINRNSSTLFYHKLREVIFDQLASKTPEVFSGEVEVDESYFGGRRKGKRGRGAAGKVPVFGLLKRQGHVHVMIIPNASTETIFPIIRQKIKPDSALSIPIAFELMIYWTFPSFIMSELTIQNYLRKSKTTSTVLKTFGTRPSAI